MDHPGWDERDPANDYRRARSWTAPGAGGPVMTASFSEFHDELRTVARDMLAKFGPQAHEETEPEPVDWQLLANAGWLGLEVAENLDGAGATFAEVAVILHEMGRAPTVCAYLGSV